MAISLGSIVVNLLAETSNFVAGMSKASQEAQRAAKSIKGSFEELGGAAETLLAPFGTIGQQIGEALGGIGNTVRGVTSAMSGLVGGLGTVGVAVGITTAAVAALGVAGAGIAVFAAESANNFHELAEKTGVSVEALSSLTYAFKQGGVGADALAGGLEKMNKSVFAAATAPAGAVNAYTRLGVSVKDAAGNIRPTQDILGDLAAAFEKMPEGPARGALAMQVFGKSGVEMLPGLLQGKEGIKAFTDEADKLGITISGKTADASHKFEQTLNTIQGALTGASNAVLVQMLPALQGFVDFIVSDLKDPSSSFREIGTMILDVVVPAFKILAGAIGVIVTAFDYMFAVLTNGFQFITTLVYAVGNAAKDIAHGNFKEAASTLKESFSEGLSTFTQGVAAETAAADDKLSKLFASLLHPDTNSSTGRTAQPKDKTDHSSATKETSIQKRIESLAAETVKESELANAIQLSRAATIEMTAAAEAQSIITDLNIQGATKHIAVTAAQGKAIGTLTLLLDSFKAALDVNKTLDTAITKTEEQTQAAQKMGAAYLQGADAIAQAKAQAELFPFEKQVSDLEAVYTQLQNTSGGFDALQKVLKSMGPVGKELSDQFSKMGIQNLSTLRSAIDDANQKLTKLKTDIPLNVLAQQAEAANQKIMQLSESTDAHIRALEGENAAILTGGQSLKDFNLQQQLQKDFPKVTADNTAAYELQRQKLDQLNQLELQKTANEKIASQLRYTDLQTEIDYLTKLRDTVKEGSDKQIAIDATIHADKVKELQDYSNLLLTTNSVGNGLKAFFLDYSNNATTAAKVVSDVMNQAFTGIQDNLTKLVTGQKTTWASLGKSLETSVASAGVHSLLQNATKGLSATFGLDLGLGGKRDGNSANNALYVTSVDSSGNVVGAGLGGFPSGLGTSFLDSGPAAPSGGGIFSGITKMLGGLGGGFGSIFKSIGGLFGGFLAGGGDVTPGRAYVVGEQRPELFVPKSAGTIVPNVGGGGNQKVTYLSVAFNGVTDHDSFKRSQGQVMRQLGHAVGAAQSRG